MYASLRRFGLRPSHVAQLLPPWWSDAALARPDGLWEFAMLLGRRLSLDAAALARGEIVPRGAVSRVAYKHNALHNDTDYALASHLAASLGEAVLAAMTVRYEAVPSDPRAIRNRLHSEGVRVIDFDALLRLSWSLGIPVIPMRNLPVGTRKMDGAVLNIADRPVIVLAKKNESKSWLSFILAHELGHVARGHLDRDSSILEIDLKKESTYAAESAADVQEAEADSFALAVLGGDDADRIQQAWPIDETGAGLAAKARAGAEESGSAAGHLVLRYAFRTRRWPDAAIALRFLDEDFEAQQAVTNALVEHVNLNEVAPDLQELLGRVTGSR